jgi:hypothetical protein
LGCDIQLSVSNPVKFPEASQDGYVSPTFKKMLNQNPEGKSPLERTRHRWEDGIKMDPREIGWGRAVLSGFPLA